MTRDSIRTAGIDTSKHQLDAAIAGEPDTFAVPNTAQGWAGLAHQLQQAGTGRVGIEAAGGGQVGVVAHLRAAGLRVAVLQPLQVKAFAAMRLARAKSDRIDAALIAA